MANYQKVRVKLVNTRLNKLKSVAESKTAKILIINKKNFQDEELRHNCF